MLDVTDQTNFPPLPRHLLEEQFARANWDGFVALPYWTVEYVGRVPIVSIVREMGSFLEADAFDKHALGRPLIDKVRVMFIADPNAVVANLLAGETQITVDSPLAFQQGMIVRREWAPRNAGTVLVYPVFYRWLVVSSAPSSPVLARFGTSECARGSPTPSTSQPSTRRSSRARASWPIARSPTIRPSSRSLTARPPSTP